MIKRILYIQYTNPAGYPPLQNSSRILADAGWSVLFLGTGAAGAGSLKFPSHPGIIVRRIPFCSPGWRQKVHYVKFCLWVLWTALVWRPRWIYASDHFSCPAAALLTFIPGMRVLYHEHDTPPVPAGNAISRWIARARGFVARRADLCVLPNAQRLYRFAKDAGPLRNSACVWNCPGLDEIPAAAASLSQGPLWLLYHGTIVPDRLPPTVLDSLALLPDNVNLRVVGYETAGAPGYVAELRRKAESLGLGDRIEFLNPVSRKDLFAITLRSSIGLALIPQRSDNENFQAMTGASNKVFDYLACGLPVIVSSIPEWIEMFVWPGYGIACNPAGPESLAAAIRELISDPGRLRQAGERGRQRILAEWNYETMFRPVLHRISGPVCAVAASSPGHAQTAAEPLPK